MRAIVKRIGSAAVFRKSSLTTTSPSSSCLSFYPPSHSVPSSVSSSLILNHSVPAIASRHFSDHVYGHVINKALDIKTAYVGQHLDVPYEFTISEADRHAWHSSFYQYDRINTSAVFAHQLRLKSHPMPFSMVLSVAVSMSHVDENREVLDLGFEHAEYIRPVYEGDTLHRSFWIKSLRTTKSGSDTVVTIKCDLFNQEGQIVFTVDKMMLYKGVVNKNSKSHSDAKIPQKQVVSKLRDQIIANSTTLSFPASSSLSPGQCILHGVNRPLGTGPHMAFTSHFRMGHPMLTDFMKYPISQIVVPGVVVLAMACSTSSRAMYEVLHESIETCSFLHKVGTHDCIGGLSYIDSVTELSSTSSSSLAEVKVVTLGLKNIDVSAALSGVQIPKDIFTKNLMPAELNQLLEKDLPVLKDKIVVRAVRKLLRQSPYSRVEQIPLL